MKLITAPFQTLRSQMLLGFLAVMLVTLAVVGVLIFDSVSTMLKNNAEQHIGQTAVQANGRLEALLEQLDSLSMQVVTNGYLQQLLQEELDGKEAGFTQRQALMPIVNPMQVFANGVQSVELYSHSGRRLYPLDQSRLETRISEEWINEAFLGKGRLIWAGLDSSDQDTVLAIRRVSLMDRWFSHGGFLVMRLDRTIFELGSSPEERIERLPSEKESMLLLDERGRVIASSGLKLHEAEAESARLLEARGQTVSLQGRDYILVKQRSDVSGWSLLILTPVSAITEGLSVVRAALLLAGGIGIVLFFVLAMLLSTMITRPIFTLIKTMRSARFGVLKPSEVRSSTMEIQELNYSYNQMVTSMNELIKLVYEKELLQSRTELKALQAQIHPHFLFNTLEALYWSLQEKDEEELAEYVVMMSELFRYTISKPGKDEWVTIGEELQHIERYLNIMRMRLGERLTWRISCPGSYRGTRFPKLLLQPLVENAIHHGIDNKIGPGTVEIQVSLTNESTLLVAVTDDGPGIPEERLAVLLEQGGNQDEASTSESSPAKGAGVGLSNVHRRVLLYYGQSSGNDSGSLGTGPSSEGLHIMSKEGAGTTVSFHIPLSKEELLYAAAEDDFSRG